MPKGLHIAANCGIGGIMLGRPMPAPSVDIECAPLRILGWLAPAGRELDAAGCETACDMGRMRLDPVGEGGEASYAAIESTWLVVCDASCPPPTERGRFLEPSARRGASGIGPPLVAALSDCSSCTSCWLRVLSDSSCGSRALLSFLSSRFSVVSSELRFSSAATLSRSRDDIFQLASRRSRSRFSTKLSPLVLSCSMSLWMRRDDGLAKHLPHPGIWHAKASDCSWSLR
mmetsp:Transcript_10673/g.27727  ORF Transcript_10673/g.27727 Transcript_10673/m.27727 type:complete len:230 (-) Transcript_10673:559-1248(-)